MGKQNVKRTKVAKKSKSSKHTVKDKASKGKKNVVKNSKHNIPSKEFDCSKLTHKVVQGSYTTWQGEGITGGSEGKIMLKLLKNARGKPVVCPFVMEFDPTNVKELDSYDMIGFSEDVEDGAEDQDLIDYEKETWTCVCGARNTNDGSYCNANINGKVCNKIRPNTSSTITGWGDLFANRFANKWHCSYCRSPNDDSETECCACKVPRFAAESSSDPTAGQPSMVAGNIGEGGFTFGVPPPAATVSSTSSFDSGNDTRFDSSGVGGFIFGGSKGAASASSGGFKFGS